MGYAVKIGTHAVDVVTGAEHTNGIVAAESTSISANLRKRFDPTDLCPRSGKDRIVRQNHGWVVEGGSPVRQLREHACVRDIRESAAKLESVLACVRRKPECPSVRHDPKIVVVRSRSRRVPGDTLLDAFITHACLAIPDRCHGWDAVQPVT